MGVGAFQPRGAGRAPGKIPDKTIRSHDVRGRCYTEWAWEEQEVRGMEREAVVGPFMGPPMVRLPFARGAEHLCGGASQSARLQGYVQDRQGRGSKSPDYRLCGMTGTSGGASQSRAGE
jgi:hypothetical protein